jgi:probable HAF family extracellular repeat protein
VIVGESFPDPYNLGRVFIWTRSSGMQPVETGGAWGGAFDINNSGAIVGAASPLPFPGLPRPFIWSPQAGLSYIDPSPSEGVALAINEAGQVVGWLRESGDATRAFIWSTATGTVDLGRLDPAELSTNAIDVNDFGTVVGWSRGLRDRAFAWTAAEGMRELPGLHSSSELVNAYGINNHDDIVGASDGRAVLWTEGSVFDLNDLVSPPTGQTGSWQLLWGKSINDSGQITGSGLFKGRQRAFRMTPAGSFAAQSSGHGHSSTTNALPLGGGPSVRGAGAVGRILGVQDLPGMPSFGQRARPRAHALPEADPTPLAIPALPTIAVYDARGRLVRKVQEPSVEAFFESWRTSRRASGVYFVRITAHGESQVRKVAVLR